MSEVGTAPAPDPGPVPLATTPAGTPTLDPLDPATQARLDVLVAELHAAGHWLYEGPLWTTVISDAAARDLWRDDRFATPMTSMLELQGITDGPLHARTQRNILALEGDDHSRVRRLVSPSFTPRSVARLRPRMRSYLHDRIDEVGPAGRCELVTAIAETYPIAIIGEVVGAPPADWPLLSRLADTVMQVVGFDVAALQGEIEGAYVELEAYIDALVAERRRAPTEDLLSDLVRASDADGDRLAALELRDLVTSLLLGGTDTTRNQLGLAVLHLARHPDQWARLGDDPAAVPAAVDEVLRFDPTASGTMRVATEDVTYRDVTFPAGSMVMLSSSASNRDPAVVGCPEAFDTAADRPGWSSLAFGTGRHFCLGANLARAELQEALTILPARLRDLRLDGEVEMKPFMSLYGPARLPVAFTHRPRNAAPT
ncbi:cytochrome P450 [Iamia majanohamensis]|uniref:Cytochrome P450 n=1 Tax=Iamia majanohamensis TaxID=467976 RepID=A0AAF0BVY0_9ACTN|nr:cytochrome P450 [Iamia majanohamensis]WCO67225.1 cytochrome P450 [Iamia majanohamensis]